MAEILIENIEMPRGNNVLVIHSSGTVTKLNMWTGKKEYTDPLKVKAQKLPHPHGDLKDYDSLGNKMANKMAKRKDTWDPSYYEGFRAALKMLDSAPTVIKAST